MPAEPPDPAAWVCPAPLATHDRVVMGHGGGGRMSADLLEHLILPALGDAAADLALVDAALVDLEPGPPGSRPQVAFTTDAFVVSPLRFPGGSIGDLAVHGTVNDLAMRGARPRALSVALVVEEGLALRDLAAILGDLGRAATRAGVRVVAGDTKVVGAGQADGLYVVTAGVGSVPAGVSVAPTRAAPGDVVVVSGPIGQHGVAVLSQRADFSFGTEVRSDTTSLWGLVATMLSAGAGFSADAGLSADAGGEAPGPGGDAPDGSRRSDAEEGGGVHVLRDPTRGGLAAALCELASAGSVGIVIDESSVPVPEAVATACNLLGLDPLHLACEGRLVALLAPTVADEVVAAMRAHPDGVGAVVLGEVVADHPGTVVERTTFGGTRIIDPPLGEHLPRIC